jgi:HNH endonuclease
MTPERLRELLSYDEHTGEFLRLVDRGRERAGTMAGTINSRGYRCIKIDRKLYKAHRLAWLYMTGSWPSAEIDHIDVNPSNNRFSNLRLATRAQNSMNKKVQLNNTCGFKGVRKNGTRWEARIRIEGQLVSIGQFVTPEMAHGAYVVKAQEIFGEFARDG